MLPKDKRQQGKEKKKVEKEKEIKKELTETQFENIACSMAGEIRDCFYALCDVFGEIKLKKSNIVDICSLLIALIDGVIFKEKVIDYGAKEKLASLMVDTFVKKDGDE